MGPTKCEVCQEDVSKYKCPKCLLKYCSVPCFKKHKADECTKKEIPPIKDAPSVWTKERVPPVLGIEKDGSEEKSEDRVPQERLDDLGQSEELLGMLENPHLQDMLLHVDSSTDAERVIHKAMLEPIFAEFADECLRVVEPDKQESLQLQDT